ncbi:hypothetical protein GCM10027040_22020 [Halomonas shantousis]
MNQTQQESLPGTGERFIPEFEGDIVAEHLHRYLMARQYVAGKTVLDIASGEGYGSVLLAEVAEKVVGVDIDRQAVDHACRKYRRDNLEFRIGSCTEIPLADDSVDIIISFETIEHHDQHDEMMIELKRVLRPGGLLIISSPDKYEYSIVPDYQNPYHMLELYQHEFESLLEEHFQHHLLLGQRVIYGSAIFTEAESHIVNYTQDKLNGRLGLPHPMYFIALASDEKLPAIGNSFYQQDVNDSSAVHERETIIHARELELEERGVVIGERDWQIGELQQTVDERNRQITELQQTVEERDGQITELQQTVDERDEQVTELQQTVEERDGQITELHQTVAERDNEIAGLHQVVEERDGRIAALVAQHDHLLNSKSWRLTQPIRNSRRYLTEKGYQMWRSLPLSAQRKRQVKHRLFTHLPFAFRWSGAYKQWADLNANDDVQVAEIQGAEEYRPGFFPDLDTDVYVPRLEAEPLDAVPVRLIALYLPQFHPIPENSEWWGEGFTEWTNVRPAQPQFEGHYQPHVPGELGYYDLLEDEDTQRRQVELAKLYGIGGFCFYFYWFGGKTLLESPIEKYLNDPELDLPFCLCWANENWSRRWDGLDQDILIAQDHSLDDDLAFIEHIARYMRDERYIRIEGKPLLVVYRPSLLPDAQVTVSRWRDWCRQNGLGEIYVACTQSFDAGNPSEHGLDAAIEFPPNNSAPPDVTDQVQPVTDFAGTVYDWRVFVERSRHYKDPGYTLFRSVCPAWDNTARKKNRGIIFANSSPRGYQEWLMNGIEDTFTRFKKPDERIMFVNAWNEWAEGAHLEPDQRYGYAYLEATRMAMQREKLKHNAKGLESQPELAVIVHAFYPEILEEILVRLKSIEHTAKLFVTTVEEHTQEVETLLQQSGIEYFLLACENRGRDILPFLKVLPEVKRQGYQCFVKLHTKKSRHRQDGDTWRQDLFDKLLDAKNVTKNMDLLRHRDIGVVSPDGHLVPMQTYWGSNAERVEKLSERLGITRQHCSTLPFVAGSMFYARLEAMEPLLNLAIDAEDFEEEAGQVDGTLAHALERAIALSTESAGYRVVTQGGCSQANDQYAFAQRSH